MLWRNWKILGEVCIERYNYRIVWVTLSLSPRCAQSMEEMSYWLYCFFKSWIPKCPLPCYALVLWVPSRRQQQRGLIPRLCLIVGMLWNLSHPVHQSSHPLPIPHDYLSLLFEQQASFLQTELMEGGSLVFCVFTVVPKKPLATPLHKPTVLLLGDSWVHANSWLNSLKAYKGSCLFEIKRAGVRVSFLWSKIYSSLQHPFFSYPRPRMEVGMEKILKQEF